MVRLKDTDSIYRSPESQTYSVRNCDHVTEVIRQRKVREQLRGSWVPVTFASSMPYISLSGRLYKKLKETALSLPIPSVCRCSMEESRVSLPLCSVFSSKVQADTVLHFRLQNCYSTLFALVSIQLTRAAIFLFLQMITIPPVSSPYRRLWKQQLVSSCGLHSLVYSCFAGFVLIRMPFSLMSSACFFLPLCAIESLCSRRGL